MLAHGGISTHVWLYNCFLVELLNLNTTAPKNKGTFSSKLLHSYILLVEKDFFKPYKDLLLVPIGSFRMPFMIDFSLLFFLKRPLVGIESVSLERLMTLKKKKKGPCFKHTKDPFFLPSSKNRERDHYFLQHISNFSSQKKLVNEKSEQTLDPKNCCRIGSHKKELFFHSSFSLSQDEKESIFLGAKWVFSLFANILWRTFFLTSFNSLYVLYSMNETV